MFSSWQPEVYINYKDSLIEGYQKILCETLRKLGYDQRLPTVEDVQKEIIKKSVHGKVRKISKRF